MQSLACNQARIAVNKRMALALTAVFLGINGYNIRVTAEEDAALSSVG